jgi:hypothetical protein
VTHPARSTAFDLTAGRAILPEQAAIWVSKALKLSEPLVKLAGAAGDASPVAPRMVARSEDWAFGNFMVAWLDFRGDVRHVCHLPDAQFFLRLLGRVYAPVFEARPELAPLLLDDSRPEMSLTNDTLQIQLREAELGSKYSMIRNHALMLFAAALWLDQPSRDGWLGLYDDVVTYVDSRPAGRPDLDQLAACEQRALADFRTLGPQTLDGADGDALLADTTALKWILEYQLYAAAAIGLLWREYRAVPSSAHQTWWHKQLSELYLREDYLNESWMENR